MRAGKPNNLPQAKLNLRFNRLNRIFISFPLRQDLTDQLRFYTQIEFSRLSELPSSGLTFQRFEIVTFNNFSLSLKIANYNIYFNN